MIYILTTVNDKNVKLYLKVLNRSIMILYQSKRLFYCLRKRPIVKTNIFDAFIDDKNK